MKPFSGGGAGNPPAPNQKNKPGRGVRRRRSNQEDHTGTWHSPQQTSEMVDLAGMTAVHNVTSRQKQHSLEERVVQDMQQGAGETHGRHCWETHAESERSHT